MRILRALFAVLMLPVMLVIAFVAVVVGACTWVAERPKKAAPLPEHERVMAEVRKALKGKMN